MDEMDVTTIAGVKFAMNVGATAPDTASIAVTASDRWSLLPWA
jgi:hypothetical protein